MYLSLKQHDLFRTLLMGFEVPFRSYIADVVISHYPTYIDFSAELNNRKATLSSAVRQSNQQIQSFCEINFPTAVQKRIV